MEYTQGLMTIRETPTHRIFTGPKRVIDRLKWERFGEAKNKTVCWSVADDVEIEFTHPELKRQVREEDEGVFITMAVKCGWNGADIAQLRGSDTPKSTFYQMFKRKEASKEAELQAKYAPAIAAINARYDAAIAKINEMYPVREKPKEATLEAPAPAPAQTQAPQGIRSRFNAKLVERKQKDEAAPANPSGGMGLSARMKQMKQVNQDNEQDSTLFVSNLSETTCEADLRDALCDKFNVRRINFVRKDKESPNHNGVGFVVLASRDEAERCLEHLNGYRLHHLILCAAFSKPRTRGD